MACNSCQNEKRLHCIYIFFDCIYLFFILLLFFYSGLNERNFEITES